MFRITKQLVNLLLESIFTHFFIVNLTRNLTNQLSPIKKSFAIAEISEIHNNYAQSSLI